MNFVLVCIQGVTVKPDKVKLHSLLDLDMKMGQTEVGDYDCKNLHIRRCDLKLTLKKIFPLFRIKIKRIK